MLFYLIFNIFADKTTFLSYKNPKKWSFIQIYLVILHPHKR